MMNIVLYRTNQTTHLKCHVWSETVIQDGNPVEEIIVMGCPLTLEDNSQVQDDNPGRRWDV